jgi:HK97 family phage portal protein
MDIQKFKRNAGIITEPIRHSISPGYPVADIFLNKLDDNFVGPGELLTHYRNSVYTCASKNAQAVAASPLKLYVNSDQPYPNLRKGIDTRKTKTVNKEEIINHPFLELMKRPNGFQSWFDILEQIALYTELTGDSYLYISAGTLGVPSELWVLPSQYMRIVPSKTKFLTGYLYGTSQANSVALKPEEIIHFKYPNPSNLFYGMSPLRAVYSSVLRKEHYDEYENALLKNNARPDFLLIPKGRYTEEQARSLRIQWQQLYGNKYGRGKPAVASGDMDVKELGWGPKEMAYLKGHKITKSEIYCAYGVPETKGDLSAANRASAQVAEYQYMKDSIKPRLIRIENKFNNEFMPRYDSRLFVEFDNCVPQDVEMEVKKQETYLKGGVLTINEIREEMGLPPVEWGNEPQKWQGGISQSQEVFEPGAEAGEAGKV